MTKFQKIVLGIVAVITVVLLFATLVPKNPNLGGAYRTTVLETPEGITVDGNTVISGTANITGKEGVSTLTSDTTLTVAQSGTTFNMGTAGLDLTLPAVASSAGVKYKFVVSATYATTNMTVVSAEGDNIEGSLVVAGAVVDCNAADVITSVADGENIGDFWTLFSDGTYWYVGESGALTASKLTCTG